MVPRLPLPLPEPVKVRVWPAEIAWFPVEYEAVNTGFEKVNPASAPALKPDEVMPLPVWALVPLLVSVIVDVIAPLTAICTLCSPAPLN